MTMQGQRFVMPIRVCLPRWQRRRRCGVDLLCGGIRAQLGYQSGLLLATYRLGAGRFVLNTLRIRENLGTNPVAERLLRT